MCFKLLLLVALQSANTELLISWLARLRAHDQDDSKQEMSHDRLLSPPSSMLSRSLSMETRQVLTQLNSKLTMIQVEELLRCDDQKPFSLSSSSSTSTSSSLAGLVQLMNFLSDSAEWRTVWNQDVVCFKFLDFFFMKLTDRMHSFLNVFLCLVPFISSPCPRYPTQHSSIPSHKCKPIKNSLLSFIQHIWWIYLYCHNHRCLSMPSPCHYRN